MNDIAPLAPGLSNAEVWIVSPAKPPRDLTEILSTRHGIVAAACGSCVLERQDVALPHVVVLYGAHMDATRACRALRARSDMLTVPVLVILPRAQRAETERLLDGGANDVVLEDDRPEEIAARVASLSRLRRLAERPRRSSEEDLHRQMFDAIPQIVWTARPDGEVEYRNRRFWEVTGSTETSEGALDALLHPADKPTLESTWAEANARGSGWECEYRRRSRTGEYRWFLGRASPQRDRAGRITRWFGSATDIHDTKRAHAQLDALVDALPAGIAIYDEELRYVRINDALAAINGIPVADHIGRTIFDVLGPFAQQVAPRLQQVLATKQPILRLALRGTLPATGSSIRTWTTSYFPIVLDDAVLGIAAVVIETTTQQRHDEGRALASLATDDVFYDWDLLADRATWHRVTTITLGYSPAEIGTAPDWWEQRIHPEERATVLASLTRTLGGAEAQWSGQYRFRRADGSYARVLDRGWIARDPGGRASRMVGSIMDLTPLLRTEAELLALFEASPVGFALLDRHHCYRRVNRALAEMDGVSPEDHIGKRPSEVLADVAPCLEDTLARVLRTREPVQDVELTGPARQRGLSRPRWLTGFHPVLVDGAPLGVVFTALDITDRKRREADTALLARVGTALAASVDVDATVRALVSAIVPISADLAYVVLREDDAVRVAGAAHVDPELAPALHAMASREAGATTHPALADEDAGGLGSLSVIRVPLRAQGALLGTLTVGSRRSRRRHDEADLATYDDLAHRAGLVIDHARLFDVARRERARSEADGRAKDEFLAVLSHELRTPLSAMLGWARLLRGHTLSVPQRERALETIERNAALQAQLVSDLLDVTRITSGKLRLDVGTVSLFKVASAALDVVRPAAEAKGIRLLASDGGAPLELAGDAGRLQQIIHNLLSNAVKFTPSGGQIEVSVGRSEGLAELRVRDTGCGIAPEFLPLVFERFRQADGSSTRRYGGVGLGLSIARHLVLAHGGTITAESDGPDRGATFVVRLPLTHAPSAPSVAAVADPPQAGPDPPEGTPLSGLRVVVIDDEDDTRALITEVLEQLGAVVTSASSVESGLGAVAVARPDVILSDIGMPGEDGYDFVRRLRASEHGDIPAIAVTAFARTVDRSRALLAGFDRHLTKPVELGALVRAILDVVRASR